MGFAATYNFLYSTPGPGTYQAAVIVEGSPTLRGSNIFAAVATTSFTVNFPAGSASGDLAILFVGAGYPSSGTPSGWSVVLSPTSASYWNGAVYSKVLSSGDISTGHVTVTTSGTWDGTLGVVVFVGAPTIREGDYRQDTSGTSPQSVTTSTNVVVGDIAYLYGSNRGASTNTAIGILGGTTSTLLRQVNDGADGSAGLFSCVAVAPVMTAANDLVITDAASGLNHQPVKDSSTSAEGPGFYTPVPVASGLKTAFVGIAYTETITVQGGTYPYTLTISSGSLPAGLSMSSSGAITGTPTTAVSSSFTVLVTDVFGFTGSQAFVIITFVPSIYSPVPVASTLKTAFVATAYTESITAQGGTSPYTFAVTSGSLPSGLSMSSSGAITGTPTVAASSSFTVTVTDVSGYIGTQAFVIVTSSLGGAGVYGGVS